MTGDFPSCVIRHPHNHRSILMVQVIIRRLLWFIPVFFVVTGLTFVTMHALPGGPFDSEKTPPALVQQMEQVFGLNRPVQEQYFIWLSNVCLLYTSRCV